MASIDPLVWYNEIDPFAAQVLRELIADGEIAPGVVDERSIEDVRPDELSRFTQCHFFAGGGVWSYALRRAGWPDDRPIWTGSCPCQPFSQAGKGEGFADKRHLWPSWQWLIDQCEPECLLGEQVADKGADAWLDLVQADLEGMGYAFGCVPLASAGFGAPNPRHRSFWVAHASSIRHEWRGSARGRGHGPSHLGAAVGMANSGRYADERRGECGEPLRSVGADESEAQQRQRRGADDRDSGATDRLGHAVRDGAGPIAGNGSCSQGAALGIDGHLSRTSTTARFAGAIGGVADAGRFGQRESGERCVKAKSDGSGQCGDALGLADPLRTGRPERRPSAGHGQASGCSGASDRTPGPVNGFWADADWLYCRDPGGPRWRPVDRGAFPLAPSVAGRVGALRVSGNAINAEVATGFIEAVIAHLATSRAAA